MYNNYMLQLQSKPENIARIEPYVEYVAKEYAVTADMFGNILISLTEAVTNAIKHGNGGDSSKVVNVQLKQAEKNLIFHVSDEGNGFDFNTLPDPTRPENVLKVGGRGVFLMKELSDNVVFSDNGSTVELRFKL